MKTLARMRGYAFRGMAVCAVLLMADGIWDMQVIDTMNRTGIIIRSREPAAVVSVK